MTTLLVLPGDTIPLPTDSKSQTFGPGISQTTSRAGPSTETLPNIIATKAGILGSGKGKDKADQLWVEGSSKRVSSVVALFEEAIG
jgi:exosome complex component RRP40